MRDRLTKRLENGAVRYDDGEYWRACYPWNEHCLSDIDRMAIKLCELEDKIEQGKIVELPCKVGQTVYATSNYFGGEWQMYICRVDNFTVYEKNVFMSISDRDGCNFVANICEIGKTVFLTREEAERALKEAQG